MRVAGVIVWILGLWKKKRKIRESHFFFYFFWWESNKKSESTFTKPAFFIGCLSAD